MRCLLEQQEFWRKNIVFLESPKSNLSWLSSQNFTLWQNLEGTYIPHSFIAALPSGKEQEKKASFTRPHGSEHDLTS